MSWTLALRFPEQIGLAIPIAGWVLPSTRPDPLHASPTRAMHGTADPIVHIEPTREWVQALVASGNEVGWLEFEGVGHTVTPEMNLQFEAWLEEALLERAPTLEGGLGEAGADEEPVEPYEKAADVDLDGEARPAPLPGEGSTEVADETATETLEGEVAVEEVEGEVEVREAEEEAPHSSDGPVEAEEGPAAQ